MDPYKLYVPNPQKWVRFFDKVADGKAKFGQSSGARKMEILPLDRYTSNEDSVKPVSVKAVAPAEQTVQQAASELKRDNINPSAVAEMIQKPEKRRRKRSSKRNSGRIEKIGGGRNKVGGRKKQVGGRRKKNVKVLNEKKDIFGS